MSVETHYQRALAADERLQNELLRVYGARLAADARYYRNHDDAGIREAKARKLEADDKLLRAMRREREGTRANPGTRRTKKAAPRRKVQPKKRNAAPKRASPNRYGIAVESADERGVVYVVTEHVPPSGPGDAGNVKVVAPTQRAIAQHATRQRRHAQQLAAKVRAIPQVRRAWVFQRSQTVAAVRYPREFEQGRADRAAGLAMQAHEWIPDGATWDAYVDGYEGARAKKKSP